MNRPIRILQELTTLNRGGAETMVMNCYRAIDRSKYQFDFLIHRTGHGDFEDEVEQLGGRVFRISSIRPWSYFSYFKELDHFFKNHQGEFAAVHTHILENGCFALHYAEKYGIKHRVCTSHAANANMDYKYIFRKFAMMFGESSITDKLACGYAAGECLYGKGAEFEVMNNPIDVKRFVFTEKVRVAFRQERGWEDKKILGNVARFCYPKNQVFIVDVFAELLKLDPNYVLVFVGEGPDMDDVKKRAKALNVEDKISFEGLQTDVAQYLSVFDVLIHPSIYEGLPISIIEAQTAGLKCFLSDTIDKKTDITGNVKFMSLHKAPKEWAEDINSSLPYKRENMYQKVVDAGYDVRNNIKHLVDIYTK